MYHFVRYKKRVTGKRRWEETLLIGSIPSLLASHVTKPFDKLPKKAWKLVLFRNILSKCHKTFKSFTNALCLKDLGQHSLHSWQLKNAKTFSTLFDMCNLSLLIPWKFFQRSAMRYVKSYLVGDVKNDSCIFSANLQNKSVNQILSFLE